MASNASGPAPALSGPRFMDILCPLSHDELLKYCKSKSENESEKKEILYLKTSKYSINAIKTVTHEYYAHHGEDSEYFIITLQDGETHKISARVDNTTPVFKMRTVAVF